MEKMIFKINESDEHLVYLSEIEKNMNIVYD